ncbi:MAG: SdpI family protein [Lachnospiraceae bacterium]|nr:SdpI family protein [Lachnospiraceae bacterium]
MAALLLLNFITPFVMILVGYLLKKHPVSDMHKSNGYNTPVSRKSQAHWDYAQSIAPDIYISLGKYLFLFEITANVILLLLRVSIVWSVVVGTCIGMAFLFYGFYYIDSKIREKLG